MVEFVIGAWCGVCTTLTVLVVMSIISIDDDPR